jgi:hypothetical protein
MREVWGAENCSVEKKKIKAAQATTGSQYSAILAKERFLKSFIMKRRFNPASPVRV